MGVFFIKKITYEVSYPASYRYQLMAFNLCLGLLSYLQFTYQKGCLYRLRTLGLRNNEMDITVDGFHSWMWKGRKIRKVAFVFGLCCLTHILHILCCLLRARFPVPLPFRGVFVAIVHCLHPLLPGTHVSEIHQ